MGQWRWNADADDWDFVLLGSAAPLSLGLLPQTGMGSRTQVLTVGVKIAITILLASAIFALRKPRKMGC